MIVLVSSADSSLSRSGSVTKEWCVSQISARILYALFWTRGPCSSLRMSGLRARYRKTILDSSSTVEATNACDKVRSEQILSLSADSDWTSSRRRCINFLNSPTRNWSGASRARDEIAVVTLCSFWKLSRERSDDADTFEEKPRSSASIESSFAALLFPTETAVCVSLTNLNITGSSFTEAAPTAATSPDELSSSRLPFSSRALTRVLKPWQMIVCRVE